MRHKLDHKTEAMPQRNLKWRHPGEARLPDWQGQDPDRQQAVKRNVLGSVFFIFLFQCGIAFGSLTEKERNIYLSRAQSFQQLGLFPVAREQYKYILESFPKNEQAKKELENLSHFEADLHYNNALFAIKVDALDLALIELTRVLEAVPQHKKATILQKQILTQKRNKEGLKKLVLQDYQRGLTYYQDDQLTDALASFVNVINIYPQHKGALLYIEKIGEKLGTDSDSVE